MTITINADSVEELKYLAGLINKSDTMQNDPVIDDPKVNSYSDNDMMPMPTKAAAPCGTSDPMSDILSKLKNIEARDPKLVGEEWANSTDSFDGEPRELEQPKGEIVDTSLRRYLKAKGDHVTVDEGTHTIHSMVESYNKFKNNTK
jgi:hypothetical protein